MESSPATTRLNSRELVKADPAAELHRALARADRRFIGISVFTKYTPGMEYWPEVTAKFGVKYVEDITDSSPMDEAMLDQTVEFVQIYNLLLFRTLRGMHLIKWEDYAEPKRGTTRPTTSGGGN